MQLRGKMMNHFRLKCGRFMVFPLLPQVVGTKQSYYRVIHKLQKTLDHKGAA